MHLHGNANRKMSKKAQRNAVMQFGADDSSPSSLPGLTRQSIRLEGIFQE